MLRLLAMAISLHTLHCRCRQDPCVDCPIDRALNVVGDAYACVQEGVAKGLIGGRSRGGAVGRYLCLFSCQRNHSGRVRTKHR